MKIEVFGQLVQTFLMVFDAVPPFQFNNVVLLFVGYDNIQPFFQGCLYFPEGMSKTI